MRLVLVWVTCAAGLVGGMVEAEAPSQSVRPVNRPASQPAVDIGTDVAMLSATAMAVLDAPIAPTMPSPGVAQPEAAAPIPATASTVQTTQSGVVVRIGADIRPRPRGGYFATVPIETPVPEDEIVQVTRHVMRVGFNAETRPTARPPHPLAKENLTLAAVAVPVAPGAPHPKARPAGLKKLFQRKERYTTKGAICGVNAIKGSRIAPIGKSGSRCGIDKPVRVTEVSGVRLSRPATIDCTTAKALNTWVSTGVKPAFGKRGGGVTELTVVAHYACRTRNNVPGGKLSEHAKGHAIDVAGVGLADGTKVTVLKGWRSRKNSKPLKKMHASACGPFGTVLGPKADRYHQDHFHVDTARYRSGSYCR